MRVKTRLGGGELGDSLGTLRHGVLGELAGEHEADGRLDLAGRERGLLVVGGELAGLPAAMRSKMSLMKEFMMDMPFLLMPVSGWTCLSTL